MSNIKSINPNPSVLDQARAEVEKEQLAKHVEALKKLLREKAAAESVVRGIDMRIADLEQQIADGTL
jgi:predicted  nucleic acid-binding Zn-ribbon protein